MDSAERRDRRVLWIHGWGMSPHVWKPISGRLAKDTEWSHHEFSYAGCRDVSSLFEALEHRIAELRPEAVVAWSMGGLLLLDWLTRRYRDSDGGSDCKPGAHSELRKLVLIGATLQFTDADRSRGWPLRVLERMQARLRTQPEDVLRQFAASMFTEAEREEGSAPERLLQPDTDMSAEGLQAGLSYLAAATVREAWSDELLPRLAAGSLRVLWIHGEYDPVCPIGAMPEDADGLERVVMRAGHAPFLTQQAAFYERLRGFLNDNDKGG